MMNNRLKGALRPYKTLWIETDERVWKIPTP